MMHIRYTFYHIIDAAVIFWPVEVYEDYEDNDKDKIENGKNKKKKTESRMAAEALLKLIDERKIPLQVRGNISDDPIPSITLNIEVSFYDFFLMFWMMKKFLEIDVELSHQFA